MGRFITLGGMIALLLSACSTSPVSRIDSNRAAYESWPLEVQEAVLNGRVKKGMTPDQVEMALGRPTEVVPKSTTDETWIYRRGGGAGSSILNNSNISLGIPIGGTTVMTNPRGTRGTTPEEEEVYFVNGVVAGTEIR
jgi:hypothetical protein